MRPDKVDAGWVKKPAPAPAQESGERRRPRVKREQGVKQEAGQGAETGTGAVATRLQASGRITFQLTCTSRLSKMCQATPRRSCRSGTSS